MYSKFNLEPLLASLNISYKIKIVTGVIILYQQFLINFAYTKYVILFEDATDSFQFIGDCGVPQLICKDSHYKEKDGET